MTGIKIDINIIHCSVCAGQLVVLSANFNGAGNDIPVKPRSSGRPRENDGKQRRGRRKRGKENQEGQARGWDTGKRPSYRQPTSFGNIRDEVGICDLR